MGNRYFIEVAYKGSAYKGFQIQPNAPTIQGKVQEALEIILKETIHLTGSSRTDAGVHAYQNFFHFDTEHSINCAQTVYSMNALLPSDISVQAILPVSPDAHCRFDAVSRTYQYYITRQKNPFNFDTAYKYNFDVDITALNNVASSLFNHIDFSAFSKLHTQVFTNNCTIYTSRWFEEKGMLIYQVEANRFLRGMVRALVGTMLKVGRGLLSEAQFESIIQSGNCRLADFSTPAKGLFLMSVNWER